MLQLSTWALLAFGSLMSFNAMASEINISGRVIASPCRVDSGSVSQTIEFDQLRSTDLKTAGTASNWKNVAVKLINCPVSTRQVTVTFDGTKSADDASLYANQQAGGASNIALQVAQQADTAKVQGPGSSMTAAVDTLHNATFLLAGRLYSPGGNTMPGKFSSMVLMSMTYQ
ncbi:putative fimbrial protein SthD [Serratia quinivorans]|uniref:fimbrial protein n=1 Tax=Serratia quinivorans TaxID=137545 RepID=UPI00217ABDF1|nr:fimbrial protein [Serratia quinivorans]CAI1072564.1 putative fimbrial protein SthD [Serratia quinivorans]